MSVLDRVTRPRDLKGLVTDELVQLAAEIREFLVTNVARTGGHLGPNLGVVELTIAIHRVSPDSRGPGRLRHRPPSYAPQAFPTGRHDFQRRAASAAAGTRRSRIHDVHENSHARPELGGRHAKQPAPGRTDRHVAVAGVGAYRRDGLGGLNNIAEGLDRNFVIVVNDTAAQQLRPYRVRPPPTRCAPLHGYESSTGASAPSSSGVPPDG